MFNRLSYNAATVKTPKPLRETNDHVGRNVVTNGRAMFQTIANPNLQAGAGRVVRLVSTAIGIGENSGIQISCASSRRESQ